MQKKINKKGGIKGDSAKGLNFIKLLPKQESGEINSRLDSNTQINYRMSSYIM